MASKIMLLVCVALVASVNGFGSGAPEDACDDMVPKHPVAPQSSPAPYTITTSSKTVKSGQPLEVIISGKGSQDTIKGFLLQGRSGNKPVGQFKILANDKFAQALDCRGPSTAVTHKKHDAKDDKRSVAFTWVAPLGFNGEIKFRATVALNGGVFWVGVQSAPVKVTS